ncbi:alpha/beta-hydrolase, partial [Saccharata proteae CBS 121410]
EYPKHIKNISYGPSDLQTLDICLPRPPEKKTRDDAVWIIYIHGGAWRDPAITSSSFEPALEKLLKSKKLKYIAGFASVNYRLSPYPNHSTNPSSPSDPNRNAQHPAHVQDIAAAFKWLAQNYGVGFKGRQWIAVGHSCGATMALQLLKQPGVFADGNNASEVIEGEGSSPVTPCGIVGLAGLYDLPALAENHADEPAYAEFLTAAFGPDPAVWEAESPKPEYLRPDSWPNGRVVVLAESPQDQLVEPEQTWNFAEAAVQDPEQYWNGVGSGEFLKLMTLKGKHDELWSKGTGVKNAIEFALELL